jgi:glycosyltransferase involved in cell wall biosynthesis
MASPGKLAVVVKGYPRLSETFIAQELRGFERRGIALDIYSLRHPTDKRSHPVHGEIAAGVTYLPEYLHRAPRRVLAAWQQARKLTGYAAAFERFRADFRRDRTRNRVRRFGQACVLATLLPPDTPLIYAHFLHTPASVARYAALMRGLPFAVSAHAVDIWTSPDWEIAEKIEDAEWATVCSDAGALRLRGLAREPEKILHHYHGLDLTRFPPCGTGRPVGPVGPGRDGGAPADPVRLLSVGRAVPKKGFDILIEALAALPDGLAWRWTHIGGGGGLAALRRQARRCGIADRIDWRGALAQSDVLAALRDADVFVLPCRADDDGNQDGLPNVLMEAQSQRLAAVSTRFAGVPELIRHDETGLLAEPGDSASLAAALERAIRDPALRQRLGAAGEQRVRTAFDCEPLLDRLAALFAEHATRRAA